MLVAGHRQPSFVLEFLKSDEGLEADQTDSLVASLNITNPPAIPAPAISVSLTGFRPLVRVWLVAKGNCLVSSDADGWLVW